MDERVPEHRDTHASSCHEPSLDPMRSVDLGKHSVYAHFPKDRKCQICQRTNIARAPCRRRNGIPIAETIKEVPRERVHQRTVEQIVRVPVPQIQ